MCVVSDIFYRYCIISSPSNRKHDDLEGDICGGYVGTQWDVTLYRQMPYASVDHGTNTGQKDDYRQFLQATCKSKTAKQLEIASGDFTICDFCSCKQ